MCLSRSFIGFIVMSLLISSRGMAQYGGSFGNPEIKTFETTHFPSRLIYLNGSNISNVKNQELRGVDVKIDESGNIYISAAHYDVIEEESFHPLLPSELPKYSRSVPRAPDFSTERYDKATGEVDDLFARDGASPKKQQGREVSQPPQGQVQPPAPQPSLPQPQDPAKTQQQGQPLSAEQPQPLRQAVSEPAKQQPSSQESIQEPSKAVQAPQQEQLPPPVSLPGKI